MQVLVDKHHRYALTPSQLFYACWKRENVLVSRNLFQYGFRFFVTMFMVRRPRLLVHRSMHCEHCLASIAAWPVHSHHTALACTTCCVLCLIRHETGGNVASLTLQPAPCM